MGDPHHFCLGELVFDLRWNKANQCAEDESGEADPNPTDEREHIGLDDDLAVLHTGAEARAREFLNTVMQKASQSVPRDILIINVTTVIGTHVGPNGLGFAAIRAGK